MPVENSVHEAMAGYIAGAVHGALHAQTHITGIRIAKAAGVPPQITLDCSGLFGPGAIAEITVTVRDETDR